MFAPRESFAEGWPIPAGHFPVYVLPSVEVEALRVASPLAPEDLHFPMRVSWVPWLIAQHSSQLNPGPLPFPTWMEPNRFTTWNDRHADAPPLCSSPSPVTYLCIMPIGDGRNRS